MNRLRSIALWTSVAALGIVALTVLVGDLALVTHAYQASQWEKARYTITNRFSCFDRGKEDFFVTCKGLTEDGHKIAGKVCPQYSGPEAMLLQYDQDFIRHYGYRCVRMNNGQLVDLPVVR